MTVNAVHNNTVLSPSPLSSPPPNRKKPPQRTSHPIPSAPHSHLILSQTQKKKRKKRKKRRKRRKKDSIPSSSNPQPQRSYFQSFSSFFIPSFHHPTTLNSPNLNALTVNIFHNFIIFFFHFFHHISHPNPTPPDPTPPSPPPFFLTFLAFQ